MASKILIVEDDKALQKVLSDFLKNEGFITQITSSGSEALEKIEKTHPDLMLLDLGLPDIKGETVLQKVHKDYPELPVVILTAKSDPAEIAQGLNLGADDYLAKPFAADELLARIKARIKGGSENKKELKLDNLTLNLNAMTAKRGKREIELTKTEFNLLKFLMENAGRVLSREIILNHVWGYNSEVESRVVDVYIGYLRKKVDKGFKKKLIKNKRGFGYLINIKDV